MLFRSSYFLQRDPKTGSFSLWRRRNPVFALDPLSGGSREEIATGVRGLGFEYYDGFDWFDNWGELAGKTKTKQADALKERSNLSGFPDAVRITLLLDLSSGNPDPAEEGGKADREPPMVFQTVVRLEASTGTTSSGPARDAGSGKAAGSK